MKKFFTLSCLLLLVLGTQAQSTGRHLIPEDGFLRTHSPFEKLFIEQQPNDAAYKLTARISSDDYEAKRFFYNSQNLIVAMRDSIGDEQVIDSVFYDDNNQVTQIKGYQLLNGNWKNVYQLFYKYDAAGNRTQRTNFNTLGTDSLIQGGVYDYTFDEENRLISHTLYLGNYEFLCETGEYLYDENGRRILDILNAGFIQVDSSMKIAYAYDENGRLASATTFLYKYDGTGWEKDDTDVFVYDDAGNCIDHSVKDARGNYTNRRLYTYQSAIPASEVHMPYDIPDTQYPEAFDDANMRVLEQWYTLDDDHVLQYICDYDYYYNGLLMNVSDIPQPTVAVYPNPTTGFVTISGENFACYAILVMDINGQVLQQLSNVENQVVIDLSDYPAGIYFVKLSDKQNGTLVKKLVKE